MVSLFSGGLKECETRRCNRFPAIVIHGENTEQLSTTFAYLDEILTNFDNNDSPTLYSIVDQNSVASMLTYLYFLWQSQKNRIENVLVPKIILKKYRKKVSNHFWLILVSL